MAKLCPKGKAAAKRKFKVYPPRTQICTHQEFALKNKPGGKKKSCRRWINENAAGLGTKKKRLLMGLATSMGKDNWVDIANKRKDGS